VHREQRAVRQVQAEAAQGIGLRAVVAQGQVDRVGRDRLARDGGHALELAGQRLERGGGHEVGLAQARCGDGDRAGAAADRIDHGGAPASVICRGNTGIIHSRL
jgi:hypothetical protein